MILGKIIFLFLSLVRAADTYELSYRLAQDTGDFQAFEKLYQSSSWSNVEDVLADWKRVRPAYFSQYVLAYRSRSLQKSSFSHPRILMFSKNADFVFTFNGDPRHRGHKNIEMMRFDHDTNKFEFFELSFEKNKAQLSEPNPAKCLACHQGAQRTGVDPRPNWEPYNAWLGFYGSLDDSTDLFKKSFAKRKNFSPETDALLLPEFDRETAEFENFWKNIRPHHSRYAFLDPLVRTTYTDEATINGDFTNRLAVLNTRRLVRLVKENPEFYEVIKWTFWSFGVCGQTFSVSDEVRDWLIENSTVADFSHLKKKTVRPSCLHNSSPSCKNTTPLQIHPSLRLTDFINLTFETFGIDTEDWSMDFKTAGRYAAFERFGLTNDPRPPLRAALERVFAQDPDFKGITCKQADQQSLKIWGDLKKVQALKARLSTKNQMARPQKPLLERCISCHVYEAGVDIPRISFDDPQKLKLELVQTGYKQGTLFDEIEYRIGPHAGLDEQMPPRGVPADKQRQELLNYLKSL